MVGYDHCLVARPCLPYFQLFSMVSARNIGTKAGSYPNIHTCACTPCILVLVIVATCQYAMSAKFVLLLSLDMMVTREEEEGPSHHEEDRN